jgi:hypothetical protein
VLLFIQSLVLDFINVFLVKAIAAQRGEYLVEYPELDICGSFPPLSLIMYTTSVLCGLSM